MSDIPPAQFPAMEGSASESSLIPDPPPIQPEKLCVLCQKTSMGELRVYAGTNPQLRGAIAQTVSSNLWFATFHWQDILLMFRSSALTLCVTIRYFTPNHTRLTTQSSSYIATPPASSMLKLSLALVVNYNWAHSGLWTVLK